MKNIFKYLIPLIFLASSLNLSSQWRVKKEKDAWGDVVGNSFVTSVNNKGERVSWKNRPNVNYFSGGNWKYSVKVFANKIIIWSTDMSSWLRKAKADSNYVKIKFDHQPEMKVYASRVQGSQIDLNSKISTIKNRMKTSNVMVISYLVETKKYKIVINLKGFTKAINQI